MFGIPEAISVGLKLIDKFIPDPEAKAKAQSELLQMNFQELQEVVKSDIAQNEVNKVEAQSQSLFKSGWRPAAGWTCVLGLAYTFAAKPFLQFALEVIALLNNYDLASLPPLPTLDITELMTLLGGLLGLGAYRSYEKKNKVAT